MSFETGSDISFNLPAHWKWCQLDELKYAEKGAIISGPFGSNISSKFFVSEGVPVIRGNNLSLSFDRFNDSGFVFITQEKAKELNTWAKRDDIIFTAAGTIGQVGIIGENTKYPNYIISNKQIRARLDTKKILPLFVYYWLASSIMVNYIQQRNTGSTIPLINLSIVKGLPIPLPPLKEQEEIVNILSALDDKIELNRQTNATLESLAQAVFKEWFVDFNFPGATGEMVDSELGIIPMGWRIGKLGDFGNIVCGKTPSKANPDFFGGEIPFIKIPDMHNSVFITKTSDSLTDEGASSQKNKFLPPYSIIVSCIATIGLVALTYKKSQTNQQINAIIPKNPSASFYLYFLTKGLENTLRELGSGGSATLNVNTTSFSNIVCIVPPENILITFDHLVRSIFEVILSNEKQSTTLATIRDTLLPKLMSGEIEV